MQMILENDEIFNSIKGLTKELNIEKDIDSMKSQFGKIITNTVDKVATYTIKAMPLPDSFKDILYDVKESFKTKDFKEIIKTIINSSVREGLEFLGLNNNSIKNIMGIKDIALKGGLIQGIKAGIDIMAKKHLNNNIVEDYVYDFFDKMKSAPFTKDFLEKVNKNTRKLLDAKEEFLDKCNDFKEAYKEFDIDKINNLANEVKNKLKTVKQDKECIRENKLIQNITELVNIRHEKLTDAQLQLCNIM